MSAFRAESLLGKEAYKPSGERLGRIEAIGMGRDRTPTRVGVRLNELGAELSFFTLAGARLSGDQLIIGPGTAPAN